MLVKFILIRKQQSGSYKLENIFVNPAHIVLLRENQPFKEDLMEGRINLSLDRQAQFTTISIADKNETKEIVVVGSPSTIEAKLFSKQKQVLRG